MRQKSETQGTSEKLVKDIRRATTESSALSPTTPYGVTKVATELFGKVYNEIYGMDVVSLRIAEVYGPGNKMPQIHRDIIRTALKGEKFCMVTGVDHRFQFIHIDDVVNAAILAAEIEKTVGYVFNISGGGYWTLRETANLIRKYIPEANIEIGDGFWHLDCQGRWDISAAERELGFMPSVNFEDGTKYYIDWLRTNEY